MQVPTIKQNLMGPSEEKTYKKTEGGCKRKRREEEFQGRPKHYPRGDARLEIVSINGNFHGGLKRKRGAKRNFEG